MKKNTAKNTEATIVETIPADIRTAHGSYENLVEMKQELLSTGNELLKENKALGEACMKLQNEIDSIRANPALLFTPVKVLRSNLSPSEAESKALLEQHGIPLPESFYTVQIDAEKVKESIALLSGMLPKKTGGRKAGQPSEANPAIGWLQSARSRLRTARKQGKTEFNSGERFRKLFGFSTEKVNPQVDAEYNTLMSALKAAIDAGGSTEQ